ncbi:predicted protein [Histoplasma capsulatum var. duboisii H88]|uniref:Predicted protein n=1 Tax=Ajellomyces capsulatus (strain H88) TaxID=544711 RepID=F0UTR5_AJEC8|nr:predicted protein [Histoplasma capsulatum var. duboisii H88]
MSGCGLLCVNTRSPLLGRRSGPSRKVKVESRRSATGPTQQQLEKAFFDFNLVEITAEFCGKRCKVMPRRGWQPIRQAPIDWFLNPWLGTSGVYRLLDVLAHRILRGTWSRLPHAPYTLLPVTAPSGVDSLRPAGSIRLLISRHCLVSPKMTKAEFKSIAEIHPPKRAAHQRKSSNIHQSYESQYLNFPVAKNNGVPFADVPCTPGEPILKQHISLL